MAAWEVEALVPPLAIGRIPLTKLVDARLMGPDERAPVEFDWTTPVPKVEKTGAEVTVNDPPMPTLPVVVNVDPRISLR